MDRRHVSPHEPVRLRLTLPQGRGSRFPVTEGSLRDVFTAGQQAAVANAFTLAGYYGPLMTAPVTSGDERVFVLLPDAFAALPDRRALEQALQELLERKVWIVEQSASWPTTEPFS